MKYDLECSMSDRQNYDEMVKRYAEMCLNALSDDEVLELNAAEYAENTWDLDQDVETAVETNDPAEAKARFIEIFTNAVQERQSELQD